MWSCALILHANVNSVLNQYFHPSDLLSPPSLSIPLRKSAEFRTGTKTGWFTMFLSAWWCICSSEADTYFNVRKQKTVLEFLCCQELHYIESLIAKVFLKLQTDNFFLCTFPSGLLVVLCLCVEVVEFNSKLSQPAQTKDTNSTFSSATT